MAFKVKNLLTPVLRPSERERERENCVCVFNLPQFTNYDHKNFILEISKVL